MESVKTFSQVVSLAHHYHPYEKSRETTLGIARSSFFGRALLANLDPSRATPTPQKSNPRAPLLIRTTPSTWTNRQNLDQSFPAKQCSTSPPLGYGTALPTLFYSSQGKNSSVCRKLEEAVTRPMDSLNHHRISINPPILPKEASLCSQLEGGSEADSTVRDTQAGRNRCRSTNKAIKCSYNKPYVCGSQKRRRLEANYRSEISQFLPGTSTLQDGSPPYVTKHYKLRVVYGKDRSQRHLSNHPDSSELSIATSFPGDTTRSDAISVPPLQTLHCTFHFLKGHKANHTISSPIRHSPYHVSRRPDASSPIEESTTLGPLNNFMAVYRPGFHCKHPKECNSTNPVSGVSGICDKYTNHDSHSTTTEDPLNSEGGKAPVVLRCSLNEDPSTFHWHPGSYKTSSTNRGFTLSCVTRSQDKSTPPILILSDNGTNHQRCPGRTTVVGNSGAHMLALLQ